VARRAGDQVGDAWRPAAPLDHGANLDAVTIPAAADWRRVARWMLLLSTLVGLATMHTLGHTAARPNPHSHATVILGPPATMASADAAGGTAVRAVPTAMTADCPDDGCGGHRHGGMTGGELCVAILGGLAVAVLLAAFLRLRAGHHIGGDAQRSPSGGPRPPPRSAGPSLVSIAVLRI
jgi:hypothetical protein